MTSEHLVLDLNTFYRLEGKASSRVLVIFLAASSQTYLHTHQPPSRTFVSHMAYAALLSLFLFVPFLFPPIVSFVLFHSKISILLRHFPSE